MLRPGAAELSRSWVSPPAPAGMQLHAPSVLSTGAGLVVAWFAGAHEGSADSRIYLTRETPDGWTPPEVIAPAPTAHWNPVLAHGPGGDLWLFFKRGPEISSWETWVVRSADKGETWTAPRPLLEAQGTAVGGRGPVKNPPLQLGTSWLAPGSRESWGLVPRWDAFIDISTDGGTQWQQVDIPLDRATLSGAGVIQPALWRGREEGDVHALMRSTEGWAYESTSRDGGWTWAPARPSSLPNNNSALTVLELGPRRLACVYNPVEGDWGLRCPLHLAVSTDYGTTWKTVAELEDGRTPIDADPAFHPVLPTREDAPRGADTGVHTEGVGEYSYPSACLDGADVVICYTWQRQRIVSIRIPHQHLVIGNLEEEKV